MNIDETSWLEKARDGDEYAFTHLVEAYQRAVFNLCFRMLGNREDAEDASQETFLRAFRSLKRYDMNRPFSTWLLSIAAHHCIDLIRRRKMRIVSVEDLPWPDLPDPSQAVEDSLVTAQERSRIQQLLAVLGATDRSIVILYYWYEFSYQEISETLHLTPSAIKSRLHRARQTMAQTWKELNGQPHDANAPALDERNIFVERMLL